MKRIVGTVAIGLGLASFTCMQSRAADFVPQNEVRQINHVVIAGVAQDIIQHIDTSEDVGEEVIPLPLGDNGATFELWVDEDGVVGKTLIDTKNIGLYMPNMTHTINIEDTWRGVVTDPSSGVNLETNEYRTRSDRLYSVVVGAAQLESDPLAPQAAREVLLSFTAQNKDLSNHDAVGSLYSVQAGGTKVLDSSSGDQAFDGPNLTGFANVDQMSGEEYLTLDTYPDTVSPSTTAGKMTVKIWPRMTAFFNQWEGDTEVPFVDGQEFDSVRKIQVHYRNVYPGSFAYVQVYPGEWKPGTAGWPIDITTKESFDAVNPQDSRDRGYPIQHSTLEDYIERWGGGEYTLEVINAGLPFTGILGMTPLETDAISHITFKVKQGMTIRGNIGSGK